MMKFIFLSCMVFFLRGHTLAQTTEQEIQTVIESMFDGMRAGDSAMVASAFSRDAIMQTVTRTQAGEVVRLKGDLSTFLKSIGTPHEKIWDEQIQSIDIKLDTDLASVWTLYKFYIGDTFSHCGVNSFQLAKLDEKWKIIYIVDTRRKTSCSD